MMISNDPRNIPKPPIREAYNSNRSSLTNSTRVRKHVDKKRSSILDLNVNASATDESESEDSTM